LRCLIEYLANIVCCVGITGNGSFLGVSNIVKFLNAIYILWYLSLHILARTLKSNVIPDKVSAEVELYDEAAGYYLHYEVNPRRLAGRSGRGVQASHRNPFPRRQLHRPLLVLHVGAEGEAATCRNRLHVYRSVSVSSLKFTCSFLQSSIDTQDVSRVRRSGKNVVILLVLKLQMGFGRSNWYVAK